jgi:hypothetical protein
MMHLTLSAPQHEFYQSAKKLDRVKKIPALKLTKHPRQIGALDLFSLK